MATHVLALDQGTTSSRAILFDRDGRIAAIAQEEFRQHYPQPGWVEHDPEEIWSSQLRVGRRVLEEAAVSPGEVAAIGITNQRETTVVWERATGRPIYRAIVWQCRRTAPLCDELKREGFDRLIRQRTGLVTDASTGQPLPGTFVYVTHLDNSFVCAEYEGEKPHAVTDDDGVYAIGGLRPGQYVVTAVKYGYYPSRSLATVEAGQTTPVDFQLVRRPGPQVGAVAGVVTDASTGHPIPGAWVLVMPDSEIHLLSCFQRMR